MYIGARCSIRKLYFPHTNLRPPPNSRLNRDEQLRMNQQINWDASIPAMPRHRSTGRLGDNHGHRNVIPKLPARRSRWEKVKSQISSSGNRKQAGSLLMENTFFPLHY
jgi:hypothetical protein